MTQEDLRERIKNELVLREGNVADWQWNRTGLPTEATELGIADFPRLVEDVSRSLNARFGKILDLQTAIQQAGADNEKHLSPVQTDLFAQDADRLGLSRPFVTEQWIPHILAKIPDSATPVSNPVVPANVPATNVPVESSPLPASPPESAERMQQKVRDILDDYKEHIPANAIRGLFRAIDYDETALAEAVKGYLSTNFYAAENEPTGQTLRDKLTSTDWRHLVWWDRPASPPVSSPPPSEAAETPPPVSVPNPSTVSVPQKRSTGLRDFLVAILIAGGLIGFVVVLIRSQQKGSSPTETRASDSARHTELAVPAPKKRETKKERKNRLAAEARAAAQAAKLARTQPSTQPRTDAVSSDDSDSAKLYDELLNDVGQYGERAAKKDGQWGLWRKGKWFIEPQYDDISVFNNGRATVTNNGHSYEIDRFGNRVKQ